MGGSYSGSTTVSKTEKRVNWTLLHVAPEGTATDRVVLPLQLLEGKVKVLVLLPAATLK